MRQNGNRKRTIRNEIVMEKIIDEMVMKGMVRNNDDEARQNEMVMKKMIWDEMEMEKVMGKNDKKPDIWNEMEMEKEQQEMKQ